MLISQQAVESLFLRSFREGEKRFRVCREWGMSLVEMLVALTILGVLIISAAPSFSTWIQNSAVRTSAESMQNALQIARSEAVHRNSQAQFVSCGGGMWNVLAASSAASAVICSASSVTAGWQMVQQSPAQTSSAVSVTASQSALIFNGLGRVNNLAATSSVISFSNASCVSSNSARCVSLNVVVNSGGQIRLCDPSLAAGSPQGC